MALASLCLRLLLAPAIVLSALCVQTPAQRNPSSNVANSVKLEPGAVIERELSGGDSHLYSVSLNAGQFLHVVVEQMGIDAVVTMLGSDGQKIASFDSPNGDRGLEPAVLLAEKSGEYRIEVSADAGKAKPAAYRIKIVKLRDAADKDKDHAAGENALAEAKKLFSQPDPDSQRQAAEKYRQALQLFESAEENFRQAQCLFFIGVIEANQGRFRQAVDYCSRAFPIFRSLGERNLEAAALNFLGGAQDVLGDLKQALGYYEQALSLARTTGEPHTEASVLSNIGKIHNDLSEWQKAIDYFNRSLQLSRSAGLKEFEANALYNMGVSYSLLGEPQQGLDLQLQALELQKEIGKKRDQAYTLSYIGLNYVRLGDAQKALDYYNRSLQLSSTLSDRRIYAATLNYIGLAYSNLGDPEKALDYHNQALSIHRASGDKRNEAITLSNIGNAHNIAGRREEALKFFNDSLSLFQAIQDRHFIAKTLQGIAQAEMGRGNYAQARKRIEESISTVEQVRSGFVSQQLRASYFASRQDSYQLYIDLLMRLHRLEPNEGHDAEALQISERARARGLLELLAQSRADIRKGVDEALIEREKSLQLKFAAKAERLIRLKNSNAPAKRIEDAEAELGALATQLEQAEAEIRKTSPRYAALTQPQPLSPAQIQSQALDKDSILLEYRLGEEQSHLWVVTSDSVSSYTLPKRSEIEETARRVYKQILARDVPSRGRKNEGTRAERVIVEGEESDKEAAHLLSKMIIGPAAGLLGNKRLLIVADGALHYIPFAALPSPEDNNRGYRPLLLDHEIVHTPSASVIAILRKELDGRKPMEKAIAVLADPVFSREDERVKAASADGLKIERALDDKTESRSARANVGFQRLPGTRREAENIRRLFKNASVKISTDFDASKANATSEEIGKYRIVHFATHGFINSAKPELSGIALSLVDAEGRDQEGLLLLADVFNLNLPVELAVLSACETGLGKEIGGEGLVGLTRGFMYAGAKRVVVSLWSVSDEATAELMVKFYEGILNGKKRPAEALRMAQKAMYADKRWAAPYYWAAFQLQGEWR